MRTLLEMSDYRVVEASNGLDAVEIAKGQRPDLILMDLTLPFLNGLSATIRIREHTELGKMPIVALSGHSTSDFFLSPSRLAAMNIWSNQLTLIG